MQQIKLFFYLLLVSLILIISYSFITNRSSYDSNNWEQRREVVVYKEKDVLKLLESLSNRQTADRNNNSTKTQPRIVTEKEPEKESSKHNYLKKYPDFLDCRKDGIQKWEVGASLPTDLNIYSKPAAETTKSIEYLRAVILYFPVELAENFKLEFKWFYRSWIEMQKSEPELWRTDIIIFIENDPAFFGNKTFLKELNCTFENKRNSKKDKPMCTLIDYKALKKRKTQNVNTKNFSYASLLSDVDIFSDDPENLAKFYAISKNNLLKYGYVDSILMAFEGYEYFKSAGYDFLIRSDMDVFLTPMFATWLPINCNDFYVGRGGYSDDFNRKRLARIARDLGLEHGAQSNLGSTWYSTPEQFRVVSYLTIFSMAYLSHEEFSQPERDGKVGTELWPQWHYGVLLLYGQNLGLNHLIGLKQMNVVKLENLIDFPSANVEDINKKLHIHVFHGDDVFSKFAFKMGKYDNMTVSEGDVDQVKFYCLKMALEAKRTSNDELKKKFDLQAARKV